MIKAILIFQRSKLRSFPYWVTYEAEKSRALKICNVCLSVKFKIKKLRLIMSELF